MAAAEEGGDFEGREAAQEIDVGGIGVFAVGGVVFFVDVHSADGGGEEEADGAEVVEEVGECGRGEGFVGGDGSELLGAREGVPEARGEVGGAGEVSAGGDFEFGEGVRGVDGRPRGEGIAGGEDSGPGGGDADALGGDGADAGDCDWLVHAGYQKTERLRMGAMCFARAHGGTGKTPRLCFTRGTRGLRRGRRYFLMPYCSRVAGRILMASIRGLGPETVPLPSETGVFAISSTTSMPEMTSPKAVYPPSRVGLAACMTKNWEPAELGSWARAMERTPRSCFFSENSGMIWYPGPPLPARSVTLPVESPPHGS